MSHSNPGLVMALMAAVCLSLAPGIATAHELENRLGVLRACAVERVAANKTAPERSVQALLQECTDQYDAVLAIVPGDLVDAVKRFIHDDIEKTLRNQNGS